MNVRNTTSYGDTPMCQIWYANVKAKMLRAGHESALWERRTDGVIPVYPLNFVHGGYKNGSSLKVFNLYKLA